MDLPFWVKLKSVKIELIKLFNEIVIFLLNIKNSFLWSNIVLNISLTVQMCRKTKEITHQLIQFQANQTLTFLETRFYQKTKQVQCRKYCKGYKCVFMVVYGHRKWLSLNRRRWSQGR